MSGDFEIGNIIILAIIAGVVLLRLRSVLGRDDQGISRDEYNEKRLQDMQDRVIQMPQNRVNQAQAKKVEEDDAMILADIGEPNVSAGLVAIKMADPSFSARYFLQGAKHAFEMILEAYGKGDKSALKPLLSPAILEKFVAEIDKHAVAGERHETTLVSVEANEITEASLTKNLARIAVRFTSEQITVTRDKEGHIVAGDPSHIEKVVDHWTFERDVKSSNPNWKLIDT